MVGNWNDIPPAPGKASGEWIDVDDRLPEEDEPVLCWVQDGDSCGHEVASHHNSFFTDWTHELLPVTHWQPLPAPPVK